MTANREFALKLNKYLPKLEKIFSNYSYDGTKKIGLNNLVKFLKEYELLTPTGLSAH